MENSWLERCAQGRTQVEQARRFVMVELVFEPVIDLSDVAEVQ